MQQTYKNIIAGGVFALSLLGSGLTNAQSITMTEAAYCAQQSQNVAALADALAELNRQYLAREINEGDLNEKTADVIHDLDGHGTNPGARAVLRSCQEDYRNRVRAARERLKTVDEAFEITQRRVVDRQKQLNAAYGMIFKFISVALDREQRSLEIDYAQQTIEQFKEFEETFSKLGEQLNNISRTASRGGFNTGGSMDPLSFLGGLVGGKLKPPGVSVAGAATDKLNEILSDISSGIRDEIKKREDNISRVQRAETQRGNLQRQLLNDRGTLEGLNDIRRFIYLFDYRNGGVYKDPPIIDSAFYYTGGLNRAVCVNLQPVPPPPLPITDLINRIQGSINTAVTVFNAIKELGSNNLVGAILNLILNSVSDILGELSRNTVDRMLDEQLDPDYDGPPPPYTSESAWRNAYNAYRSQAAACLAARERYVEDFRRWAFGGAGNYAMPTTGAATRPMPAAPGFIPFLREQMARTVCTACYGDTATNQYVPVFYGNAPLAGISGRGRQAGNNGLFVDLESLRRDTVCPRQISYGTPLATRDALMAPGVRLFLPAESASRQIQNLQIEMRDMAIELNSIFNQLVREGVNVTGICPPAANGCLIPTPQTDPYPCP